MDRNEAIEIVRKNYPYERHLLLNEALETLIPELKESEDERIRRELIDFHKNAIECLELPEKEDNNWEIEQHKKYIAWLEKQGEKEEFNEASYRTGIKRVLDNPESYGLEKQGSQNLANSAKTCKVEPKFKVGDWVRAISSGNIFKILSVNDVLYRVLCYDGAEANYPIEVEKDLAYWTIQDAKDGDVLYSLDSFQPFIYKERKPLEQATAYCGLNIYGKFFVWGTKDCVITLSDYVPATKEQRDTLFAKMHEAGYEWDAKKKDLIKIEQNPAWSEKDEIGFRDAMWAIEQAGTIAKDENDLGNLWYAEKWLKSLKERYTWKPSEEQIISLDTAIARCIIGDKQKKALKSLIKDLNKLK